MTDRSSSEGGAGPVPPVNQAVEECNKPSRARSFAAAPPDMTLVSLFSLLLLIQQRSLSPVSFRPQHNSNPCSKDACTFHRCWHRRQVPRKGRRRSRGESFFSLSIPFWQGALGSEHHNAYSLQMIQQDQAKGSPRAMYTGGPRQVSSRPCLWPDQLEERG